CTRLQDYRGALAIARKAEEASKTSSGTGILAVADGIVGVCLYWLGGYEQASVYARRAHGQAAAPTVRQTLVVRLCDSSLISAGVNLARINWALGRPDQAAQLAQSVLTHAEAAGDPLTLCFALTWCGCLIPLWRGELPSAELATSRLKDYAGKHAFSAYYANGVCLEG